MKVVIILLLSYLVVGDFSVFNKIYEDDYWTQGSGPGSIPENTILYRKYLQNIFDEAQQMTIVDLGCGDWQIMSMINIQDSTTYIGVDAAKFVIDRNMAKYNKQNVIFQEFTSFDNIPDGDILIIKDVMQHWSIETILEFSSKILPRFNFVLMVNDYCNPNNQNIKDGGHRCLDLEKSPINILGLKLEFEYPCIGYIKKVQTLRR